MYLDYKNVVDVLRKLEINPILYGSLGASVYLGKFKEFGDIDLLIEDVWLNAKWPELIELMINHGFTLTDEHEHEFQKESVQVSFASQDILQRDGISNPVTETVTKDLEGIKIRTLSPEAFIKAYLFSSKDGYRKNTRGKKDLDIVALFEKYLLKINK